MKISMFPVPKNESKNAHIFHIDRCTIDAIEINILPNFDWFLFLVGRDLKHMKFSHRCYLLRRDISFSFLKDLNKEMM